MTLFSRIVKSQDIQFTGDVVNLTSPRPVVARLPFEERAGKSSECSENGMAASGKPGIREDVLLTEAEQRRIKEEAAAILAQAREEARKIKETAYQEGFTAGNEALTKDILQCIQQVSREMSELHEDHERFCLQYESSLLPLAASISSKILCKRISEDDAEMDELIRNAVESVRHADWISIEVSEKMAGHVKILSRELQASVQTSSIGVTVKNAAPGLCLIKTPQVVLDASISTQLENLKRQFQVT